MIAMQHEVQVPATGRETASIITTTTAMPFVIETRALTKRYGETPAVDHLDLHIRRGEVYGLLGRNGAGKTTTMRMLLGLIRPTSGTARLLGQPPGAKAGLLRTGAMIETPAFYPFLSGRDNLALLARHAGISPDRIMPALREVSLDQRADDRFQTYSLGMKQRLGLAAVLLKDPELLILDEPTNGLDPAGMAEIRDLIRQLGQGRRTVVLSSHLMNEVELTCDRIGIIDAGKLVAEGTVDALRGHDRLLTRAEPVELARTLTAARAGVASVEVDEDVLHVAADPAEAPAINRELVGAGVAVSELRPERASLETIFLNLTGNGGVQHG
jgi:ABC-2 type transport system ATP-binding protein